MSPASLSPHSIDHMPATPLGFEAHKSSFYSLLSLFKTFLSPPLPVSRAAPKSTTRRKLYASGIMDHTQAHLAPIDPDFEQRLMAGWQQIHEAKRSNM
jgi:hypothetical protein